VKAETIWDNLKTSLKNMEASESHSMKAGEPAKDETKRALTGVSHIYSDRVQAELLNLQSETELLFARLQALSRSRPAAVG
jgi:hypothetical protein